MNIKVGPFNLMYILITMILLLSISIYLILKKKLGVTGLLVIFFFPFVGSLGIIIYSLLNLKKSK